MLYLEKFRIPDQNREEKLLDMDLETKRSCYGSKYPFCVFWKRELPTFEFEPITILCGGNGSGKTTLLNLMGEKLKLQRESVFNRSSFYEKYLKLCAAKITPNFDRHAWAASRVITSDDVFDSLLDLRSFNENIDTDRRKLLAEYGEKRRSTMRFRSMEDLDELRKVVLAKKQKRPNVSLYVNGQLRRDVPGQSNGESAFAYFTRHIQEGGLYLLDEPENSLSAGLQQKLAAFLQDSARFYACQFVIATHSPFLLSLRGAKIYDLDANPVSTCRWTEVETVRAFYDFFKAREAEFE